MDFVAVNFVFYSVMIAGRGGWLYSMRVWMPGRAVFSDVTFHV